MPQCPDFRKEAELGGGGRAVSADGWEPVGERFRVRLNHHVHIPSAAVAIHGYTEEFLRKNGEEPLQAHAMFRDFAGDLPVVAHNLSFDLLRACLRLTFGAISRGVPRCWFRWSETMAT